ncbi:zinc finger protein [Biomphalaria glabrata]
MNRKLCASSKGNGPTWVRRITTQTNHLDDKLPDAPFESTNNSSTDQKGFSNEKCLNLKSNEIPVPLVCVARKISTLFTLLFACPSCSRPLSLDFDRNTYEAPRYTRPSEMVSVNSGGSNLWSHRRLSYPSNTSLVNPRHSVVYSDPDNIRSSANSVSSPCYRRQSRDVHGNPLFSTCSKCGGKYTNPGMCASHEASCNGSNRLMCHICKRVYSQMCALKEHLRGKHGLGELLSCKHCGRSFKYKPQLYDHSCSGINQQALRAGRSFQDVSSLDPCNVQTQEDQQSQSSLSSSSNLLPGQLNQDGD